MKSTKEQTESTIPIGIILISTISRYIPSLTDRNYDMFQPNQLPSSQFQILINILESINPYPTAFPYGNGMVLHFYQQQESSTTKTVHKVINKGLKAYV